MKQDILIYGVGNEILSDDAIGPKLTRIFEKTKAHPRIKFETAFIGGLDLLDYIQGFETGHFQFLSP